MECVNGSDQGAAQAQKQTEAEAWVRESLDRVYDDPWEDIPIRQPIPLWLIGLAALFIAVLIVAASHGQTELSESRRVLSVDVRTENTASRGYGSGTIIATQGDRAFVLTARHLFRPTDTRREIVDYGGKHYAAKVVAVSETNDLALMESELPLAARARLQARGLDPARSFALTLAPKASDRIQIAGYGEGRHQLAAQTGDKISGPHTLTTRNRTLTDCYLYRVQPRDGDSGGGAFSSDGFAGVVTHRPGDSDRVGVIAGPDGIRQFLEMQCLNGVCSTGLTIDGPGVSIRQGRFAHVLGALGGSGGNGQFFERYRRGPWNWMSYTRRGYGGGSGFVDNYGGVLGGGRGTFSSFPSQNYGATYPIVQYAADVIPTVISPAYAPIFAADPVILPSTQVVQGGLVYRVGVLEQRLANVERIIGP
jgi:hypothetical protein